VFVQSGSSMCFCLLLPDDLLITNYSLSKSANFVMAIWGFFLLLSVGLNLKILGSSSKDYMLN